MRHVKVGSAERFACSRAHTGRPHLVLERDRHTMQRARFASPLAVVGGPGLPPCVVGGHRDERVQLAVEALDARQ
jgi:hypothetical protein